MPCGSYHSKCALKVLAHNNATAKRLSLAEDIGETRGNYREVY